LFLKPKVAHVAYLTKPLETKKYKWHEVNANVTKWNILRTELQITENIPMKILKLLVGLAVVAAIVAFFVFDLGKYFTLDSLKAQQAAFKASVEANPTKAAGIFAAIYIGFTALALPAAGVLSLMGGALFGLWKGAAIVVVSATIGATLAFLGARFLLRDWVQAKFGSKLKGINEGVEKEGAFYLFGLRLVPVVPFFLINTTMGLTPMKTLTYFWVSLIGMIPGTLAYVNAGQELGKITSLKGILSPGLLLSFVILGLLPLVLRKVLDFLKARKVYSKWPKPATFDRNVVVIGAGSGGLVSAYIAAAVKAKVTLVEKHKMGGDCLNTGCVPSKALIRSAKLLSHMKRSKEFGVHTANAAFDFKDVMERVQHVVKEIEPHDSVDRYSKLGVECMQGTAKILSPFSVEITHAGGRKEVLTTKNIIIAAGARPFVPPIPGIENTGYFTSDTMWSLRELPKRVVVLGGGPIGSEMTQCFARFGAHVSQVEMAPRLLVREDPEFSAMVQKQFERDGVRVLVNHKANQFVVENGEKVLIAECNGVDVRVPFDALIVAVGRTPNVTGYGLEELGIPLNKNKTVETNEYLQTLYPNIFAVGDVAGPYQFTHVAAHQAWYAAVNALFGTFKKFKADYRVIPWATFTEPEVARVGLNEQDAKEKGIAYEVTTFGIDDLDRAIADGEAHGLVKVLTVPGKDTILGVTIAGEHAGDLIAEYVMAMKHGLGMNKILGTIHIYPTLAEANKYAAGQWKQAHKPEKVLAWVEKFHAWRRG
jgi:dihydrolipoamide dehydrogenase